MPWDDLDDDKGGKSRGHILVVEQNDITRKLITGILIKKGYDIYEATSGGDGVGFLAKDLQLIILDIESDNPANMGLIRKLQMNQSRVPLIALTEEDDLDAVRKRLHLDKVAVLQKPVMPDALIQNVESSLLAGVAKEISAKKPNPTIGGRDPAQKAGREDYMRRAIDLSQEKMDANCGGPFGAVIVRHGKIVAEGWNQVTSQNDPTAHAEIVAIRAAAKELGHFDLSGCEVYSSCEPCPMCLAALYWARVDRIFYGNTREDAASIGFDDDMIYREFTVDESKRTLPSKMFLREEAKIVFANWLKKGDKVTY